MEKLYLAERINIVGAHENRSKFAERLLGYAGSQPVDGPWQQLGTWVLIGMTGRWQRVLGLWEWADGWDGFSDLVEETMIRPADSLGSLYSNIDDLRSGGEDWVMTPGIGCPSRADLVAGNVKGSLMSYETAHVEPGTEEDYMEAIRNQWAPVAERLGYALIGNYQASFIDGLVFTAWAMERQSQVEMARSVERQDWRQDARKWTRSWQEELWISAPGSLLAGPETTARF